MSDHIIPIVSTTPPPIDDDFGDDDEFQEYSDANICRWDDADDLCPCESSPAILDVPLEDKDSSSFITCSSNLESPQLDHQPKVLNNLDTLSKGSDYLDNNHSFFSDSKLCASVPDDSTESAMPKINHSVSPISMDDKPSPSDTCQQVLPLAISELSNQNMNTSSVNRDQELDMKDHTLELYPDNTTENTSDKMCINSNSFDSDTDISGYPTSHSALPNKEKDISATNDLGKIEESANARPTDLLEALSICNKVQDAKDFPKSEKSLEDPNLISSNPCNCEQEPSHKSDSGADYDVDAVEQNQHKTDGFVYFASFDQAIVPKSQTYDNSIDFHDNADNNNRQPNNFANIDSQRDTDTFSNFQSDSAQKLDDFAAFDQNPIKSTNNFDSQQDTDDFGNFPSNSVPEFDSFAAFDQNPIKTTDNFAKLDSQQDTDDFANFQSDSAPKSDDFAAFDQNPVTSSNNFDSQQITSNFASFQSDSAQKPDDFAAFDHNPIENADDFDNNIASNDFDDFVKFDDNSAGDGDDFGDFDTAEVSTLPSYSTFTECTPNDISKIGRWFPQPTFNSDEDETITDINHHIEQNSLPLFEKDQTGELKNSVTRPSAIWNHLEDVDNALALKFRWNNSMNHQKLLKALQLDPQNVLFRGVPVYYAGGLGVLQPNSESLREIDSARTSANRSPASIDSTIWKTDTATSSTAGSSNGEISSPHIRMNADKMNLDALDQVTKRSSNRTPQKDQDKLDPELLELAMAVTPDPSTSKKTDPLSKILASLKVTGRKNSEEEEETLSEEAAEVVRKLPDLSFMRSGVLMFPVSQSAAN